MMCPKCAGLLVSEWVTDYFRPFWQARCLQCGMILDSVVWHNRQLSIAREAEVAPVLSPAELRKRAKAAMARSREGRKQANDPMIFIDGEIETLSMCEPCMIFIQPSGASEDSSAVHDRS